MPRDGRRLLSLNIANRVLDGLHREAKSVYKRTCWVSRIVEVRKCQVGSQAGIEGRRKFSRDWQTVPHESDTSYSIPTICVGPVQSSHPEVTCDVLKSCARLPVLEYRSEP